MNPENESIGKVAEQTYFHEYQEWCATHPTEMMQELERWERADTHILGWDLQSQASYADYVTRKMCTTQPIEVIVHQCATLATELQSADRPRNHRMNSCAIGNIALYVLTIRNATALPPAPTGNNTLQQVRVALDNQFERLLTEQRALPPDQLQCLVQ